jgi:hypothetical protein
MTLPLLALTIFLLISLRYASLGDIFFFVPVKEERASWRGTAGRGAHRL